MTDADRKDIQGGMAERDPEMVSGTTGLGSDINADMGGVSGSIASGTSNTGSQLDSDPIGADDVDTAGASSVGADVDMSGAMGGTGGIDITNAPPLDSDAVGLRGPSSGDTDASAGNDSDMATGIGEDAGDIMPSYGSEAGDPTAGTSGDMDSDIRTSGL